MKRNVLTTLAAALLTATVFAQPALAEGLLAGGALATTDAPPPGLTVGIGGDAPSAGSSIIDTSDDAGTGGDGGDDGASGHDGNNGAAGNNGNDGASGNNGDGDNDSAIITGGNGGDGGAGGDDDNAAGGNGGNGGTIWCIDSDLVLKPCVQY